MPDAGYISRQSPDCTKWETVADDLGPVYLERGLTKDLVRKILPRSVPDDLSRRNSEGSYRWDSSTCVYANDSV